MQDQPIVNEFPVYQNGLFHPYRGSVVNRAFYVLFTSAALAALPAAGQDFSPQFRLGAGIGTSGFTVEPQMRISPAFGLRGTAGLATGTASQTFEDVDYSADIRIGTIGVLFDFFPLHNGLRLTAGAVTSLDRAELLGEAPSLTIGSTTYSGAILEGEVKQSRPIQPVIAVGYSSYSGSATLDVDIGARFAGNYDVDLRNGAGSTVTIPDADLRTEADLIEEDLRGVDILPYIKIGIAFNF